MKKLFSFLVAIFMMMALVPFSALSVFAYYESPFFDNEAIDVCTQGKTYSLFTNENLERQNGTTFLYVVKSGDRYYTLSNPRYTQFNEVDSVPAVDITDYYDAQTNTFSGISDSLNVGAMQYQMGAGSYMYVDGDMLISLSVPFESEGNAWFDGGIRYFPLNQTYSYTRPMWHSNDDGSGYFYNSYKDWYGDSDEWVYGVLYLKSDGTNYTFALCDKSAEYTEAKNAEPDNYDLSVDLKAYLYAAPCGHEKNVHGNATAPTCMEKGCHEYWYCRLCNTYFSNAEMTSSYDGFPEIDALGHDWNGEKCNNCNRPVPVYSKITNKTDFLALADDTMYVLVAEYGGKYYTPDSSILYLYVFDLDGDGYADIYNVDENNNGTPDVAEIDYDENGTFDLWDYETEEERCEYFNSICQGYLVDMLYGQTVGIPVKEITLNSDGTISHDAVKDALEFEMIKLHNEEEINNQEEVFRYACECVMQFVVPNTFINSPAFIPADRPYDKLYPDEGDTYYWAVLFYNDRNSYYTYDWSLDEYVGGLPFLEICKEDSIALSKSNSTFSPEWGTQLECLRLRDYNGKLSFVLGSDYNLEGSEWVEDENYDGGGYQNTNDTQACIYLYASAPYTSHTCDFGDWVDDENGTTHTRTCKDAECGKTETLPHNWGEGVQSGTANCLTGVTTTYTCNCGATKSETAEGLGHNFGEWYETEDGMKHRRDCTASDCDNYEESAHTFGDFAMIDEHFHGHTCAVCNAQEKINHSFYDWIAKDDNYHVHKCMECEYEQVLAHDYVREVTKEPTESEVGEATYTCSLCSHFYTEELPKKIVQVSGDVVGVVINVPVGSNAYIPEGTIFDVVEQPTTEVPEQLLGEIAVTAEGVAKPLGLYDLSLLLEGATIQPNGMVSVTLPAPALVADYDSIIVVYIAPDGSYEECKTTVNEDGTITFETNHFSQYAVIGITNAGESGKKTGCKSSMNGSIGLMALAILGFAVVTTKKRLNK